MTEAPRVTVAGGGLAGLTAALRLAERGYRVKLYEQKSMLGGDLASRPAEGGVELDVYPHMYLSWYHNFWRLLGDVTGVDRGERFLPFSSVRQLRRGDFPRFTGITDMYSAWRMFQNLFSGVGPPADMFVFGYASIDLLAERLNPTMLLDNVSVTGFLHARPYMTERAAAACDSFITMVWAIPSYLASAEDYRTYLAYSFAEHTPAFWLARGSALQQVIGPLTAGLEAADVEIVRSVQVTSVSCTDGRVTEIGLQDARFDPESYTWVGAGDGWIEEIDELVLAVPPDALSSLVRRGKPGHRIVEVMPRLAEVSRLRTQRIPILHLYFTRKLRRIPAEPVGLFDSRLALAFTDISQAWEGVTDFAGNTVLSVSASEPYGLPGTGPHDDALAMLLELAEYLDFDPGTKWGESSDIDWERTRYEANADAQLFVNETGTDVWRPAAACDGVSNLSFAGDFCANRIGMTTIESAVTTGLEAARVIVERRGIGAPVEIAEPDSGTAAFYAWLRYAWAPYAFAAKAWSTGTDCVRSLRDQLTPARPPRRQRRES
jgi:flavin-dependent amine oxidoreductase